MYRAHFYPTFIPSSLDVCALTASALEQSACDLSTLDEMIMGNNFSTSDEKIRQLKLDEISRKEGINFHPALFRQLPSDLPSNKNDQIRLLGVSPFIFNSICFNTSR